MCVCVRSHLRWPSVAMQSSYHGFYSRRLELCCNHRSSENLLVSPQLLASSKAVPFGAPSSLQQTQQTAQRHEHLGADELWAIHSTLRGGPGPQTEPWNSSLRAFEASKPRSHNKLGLGREDPTGHQAGPSWVKGTEVTWGGLERVLIEFLFLIEARPLDPKPYTLSPKP